MPDEAYYEEQRRIEREQREKEEKKEIEEIEEAEDQGLFMDIVNVHDKYDRGIGGILGSFNDGYQKGKKAGSIIKRQFSGGASGTQFKDPKKANVVQGRQGRKSTTQKKPTTPKRKK